jgi:hypothetical protein
MNLGNKKTRPALVIGLGGTGQWVLTYLKKDLLEFNYGTMPSNVKLLAFDTVAQPQMGKQTASTQGAGGKDVRVGGVELVPDDEFIHLCRSNPDLFPWGRAIVDRDEHHHISPWFQAAEYMALPRDAWVLSTGAGQIRQFGRMAIFNDLSQPVASDIWGRIRQELSKIRNSVDGNNKLEVIIVGSLAGGTGAGMFVDMAILLRAIAEASVNDNFIVRGFFALPSVFGLGGNDPQSLEMRARAFAAWRELDRFMIQRPNFGVRHIDYHEYESQLKLAVKNKPFDACYLIDSVRSNNVNMLNTTTPEDGVFPSIADAISAILDPTAGRFYTEQITANLLPIYMRDPNTPMYSAIGTYTMKVPVYYTVEEVVHLFAKDALDRWLRPLIDNRGRITGLHSAQSEEIGIGKPGSDEALAFLQKVRITHRDSEQVVTGTGFIGHIAKMVFEQAQTQMRMVNMFAMPKGAVTNLGVLTELGDSKRAKDLRAEVDQIIGMRFRMAVPPSRDQKVKPIDDWRRIESDAERYLIGNFGMRMEDGTQTRGKYGEALNKCGGYQVANFREMLALHVENLLMGASNADAVLARSGKLGYVYDFVKFLISHIDEYISFLDLIDSKRQEGGKAQTTLSRYETAKKRMRDMAPATMFFGALTNPKAHQAQEDFVKAGQDIADMRCDDLLVLSAREAAVGMRVAAKEMEDRLYEWVVALVLGTSDYVSLYTRITESLEYLREGLDRERRLDRVQQLVGAGNIEELYLENYEALEKMMSRIFWRVIDDVETRGRDELRNFSVECAIQYDNDTISMAANNMDATSLNWMSNARTEYEYIPAQQQIGDVLVEKYGENGATALAQEIARLGEPLWQPEPGRGGANKMHNFVRVYHTAENEDPDSSERPITAKAAHFFGEFSSSLGQQFGAANLEVKLVNSSDRYKMTVIRSDDCIPSDRFRVYHMLKQSYIDYIQRNDTVDKRIRTARLLHIFAPECTIAEYEARWSLERRRAYEVFVPELVMVLTDKGRATLFALAFAAGFIELDVNRGAAILNVPGYPGIYLLNGVGTAGFDFFKMMDNFVNYGFDARDGNQQEIPYDPLWDAILEKTKSECGSYADFLKLQLNGKTAEDSLYVRLTEAATRRNETRYGQLAEIVRFMFEDELKRMDRVQLI